ncbi:MAG: hypothetical protein QMC96_09860 [Methanomicrobiales archaeon]|nr:hypothetical protein [Methanomicrobiales archaeon]
MRALCRDIAFALEGQCLTRGKRDLDGLKATDPTIVIVCRQPKGYRLQVIHGGEVVADYPIPSFSVRPRSSRRARRGLSVSNRSVFEELSPYLSVEYTGAETCTLEFDGTQARHYVLEVLG